MPSTSNASLLSARPRVRLDGTDRPNLGEAALALTVHLPATGMGSAELRVLNWGQGGAGQPDFPFLDVRLGSRIELLLGEAADQASFDGEITALEERYGDGAPQLVILAEDALHRLARSRASRAFEDMSLDDVVRSIAGEAGLDADVQVGGGSATWLQMNESHLAFLLRHLGALDIGLRMQDGRLRAREEEADPQPVRLDPGSNASRIRLISDLNRQPREVAVNGYDLAADGAAQASSSALQPPPMGSSAADKLLELGWDGPSVRPHPFARSQAEAEALANAAFRRDARRFVHGEIVCRDTPLLRSGREVELAGVSPRLAGRYRVTECWHQFDGAQGLVTRIRVQRPDWST